MDDLISRQAALDAMETWDKFGCDPDGKLVRYDDDKHYIPYVHYEDMVHAIKHLPSAQPEKETAKRVLWTGWKGCRDTRYKCPNCKKPVKNDDIYCHRCGQKLMFPHISFTDYVPGEKQETIVRWDDE